MSNNNNNIRYCASCNQPGHSRKSHRDCPLNPANISNVEVNVASDNGDDNIDTMDIETQMPVNEGLRSTGAQCSACLQFGHSRRTSRLCLLNPTLSSRIFLKAAMQTDELPERHDLGRMSAICPSCNAYMWIHERAEGGVSTARYQLCCGLGRYILPPLEPTPQVIADLLKNNNSRSVEFRKNVRSYNNALGFTSMGVNLDSSVQNSRGGAYAFRIHGSIYHRIGSLLPTENNSPAFAQIYVYDASNEISNRHSVASHVDVETLEELQTLMHNLNPIVRDFKTMAQFVRENPDQVADISMVFRSEGAPDPRRYNAPTTSTEVGVIILGSGGRQDDEYLPIHRDIVIRPQDGGFQKISELHQMYDPMSYVLLFPSGQYGWNKDCVSQSGVKISTMQFYSFRLMYRGSDHCLHLFGKLFHQYVVDMYAKIEQFRLNFIRNNQSNLRSELYRGLQDAVAHDDTDTTSLGLKVILPSTFIGGPRHMAQLYQDSVSIVRRLGKPDYFITFTCNPAWPEIKNELLFGQTAADRPDLCTRVFRLKFKELMKDLTKNHILGKVIGHVSVIEFQKRGLPHAHILIIVSSEDKLRTPEDYDKVVSAEIPDQNQFPLAYATVTRNMMHGPCGPLNPHAVCMKDGKCSKGFPKKFIDSTTTAETGYPLYRRRRDGRYIVSRRNGVVLDNTWVVPHNIYLCTKYDAHINVEICCNVAAVKYLYKYVYKGHDRANVLIRNNNYDNQQQNNNNGVVTHDEINHFIDARYVSAPEAIWRIFGFSLHKEYPSHQRLSVHLPNQQMVFFEEGSDLREVLASNSATKDTTLTAWFKSNQVDPHARQYLYTEFPEYYIWNKKEGQWQQRQRGFHETIGRIYSVSPRDVEKFYLRMLLNHVRGAKSFEEVRTVNGTLCETFQAAARALGLLNDDEQWDMCLIEGNSFKSPVMLRRLYCTILLFCEPSDPLRLWNSHKDNLSADYLFAQQSVLTNETPVVTDSMKKLAYDNSLLDINDLLNDQNMRITDFEGFELPTVDTRENFESEYADMDRQEREQRELCFEAEVSMFDPADSPFNIDQRLTFDTVMQAFNAGCRLAGNAHAHLSNNLYFIDGPGGTGKTFLFNAILQAIRRTNNIALSVAVSGTAALLLKGGRTAHSRFRIPLTCNTSSVCSLRPKSPGANLIALSAVIVWDEASMISRDVLETVDRTFRDIMKQKDERLAGVPFGGKLIVFGGDFRQVLPVVPKGSKDEIIRACILSSTLWKHVQVLKLSVNMRVQQAISSDNVVLADSLRNFSDFLLTIGNGTFPIQPNTVDTIRIPASMLLPGNHISDLCKHVYNNFAQTTDILPESLVSKAILTPTNAFVTEINDFMLEKFPGSSTEYLSTDTALNEDDALDLPSEFMNSLNCGSLPPHKLKLKLGSPIMMLRNLDPAQGICNGTRLICRAFTRNAIQAEVATGPFKGNVVLIPRVSLNSTIEHVGIEFKRCQFPIRPAFAMTINKSQGQTLETVGLYLPVPVFSHGQLYVALSRVKRPNDIKILVVSNSSSISNKDAVYTSNVVYTELFRN